MNCEPNAQTPGCVKTGRKRKMMTKDYNSPNYIPFGHHQMVYGETPVAVVRDHLNKMVETLEFPSVVDLCKSVIKMSAVERLEMLQQFYTKMYGSQISSVFQQLPQFSQSLATGSSREETPEHQHMENLQSMIANEMKTGGRLSNSEMCQKKVTKLHDSCEMKSEFGHPFSSSTTLTSKTNNELFENQKVLDNQQHSHVPEEKYSTKISSRNNSSNCDNPKTCLKTIPDSSEIEPVIFTEVDSIFFSDSDHIITHHKRPPKSKSQF